MKLSHILLLLTAMLLLASLATAQMTQMGTFKASESTPNYSLASGNGDRMVGIDVKFDKPFMGKPQVALGVTAMDGGKEGNVRYEVKADAITRDGFTIQLKTWADSKIFMLAGNWVAFDTAAPAMEKAPAKMKKGKK